MDTLSYNEEKNRQTGLRHIFLPTAYGLVSETVIGVIALVLFNLSELSDELVGSSFGEIDPLSLLSQSFNKVLDAIQGQYTVQQVTLFMLWAIVGALIYVLAFRTIQMFLNVKHSVGTGVKYVQKDHTKGLFRWLASLHDFFITILIVLLGGAAIASGALICFGVASQELHDALASSFPANTWRLLLSLLGAMLSVRFIAIGLSLLSKHFRNWYKS